MPESELHEVSGNFQPPQDQQQNKAGFTRNPLEPENERHIYIGDAGSNHTNPGIPPMPSAANPRVITARSGAAPQQHDPSGPIAPQDQ